MVSFGSHPMVWEKSGGNNTCSYFFTLSIPRGIHNRWAAVFQMGDIVAVSARATNKSQRVPLSSGHIFLPQALLGINVSHRHFPSEVLHSTCLNGIMLCTACWRVLRQVAGQIRCTLRCIMSWAAQDPYVRYKAHPVLNKLIISCAKCGLLEIFRTFAFTE